MKAEITRPSILMLSAFVPCRMQAGHNFTRQLIADLSKDYDIDLAYFRYSHEEAYRPDVPGVRVIACEVIDRWNKLANVLRHPLTFPQFSVRDSASFIRRIRGILACRKYDAVYLDHSQMFCYSRLFDGDARIILMAHDVQAQRFGRLYGGWLSGLCSRFERRYMTLPNVRVLTFSAKDADIVKRLYGVEAGVVGFYLDTCVRCASAARLDDCYILFAAWSRRENREGLLWFARSVIPLLVPGFRFVVIGGGLSEEDRRELSQIPGFTVRGFVDDPYPVIASARALIAPLFKGAGVKVKVIESLAVGTDVIGTDVAFEGVPDEFLDAMHKCESAHDFANAIMNFRPTQVSKSALKARFLRSYGGRTAGEIISHMIRNWKS